MAEEANTDLTVLELAPVSHAVLEVSKKQKSNYSHLLLEKAQPGFITMREAARNLITQRAYCVDLKIM